MLRQFPNGDSFATGAIRYDYRPVSAVETTNRLILPVEIEGILTEMVVDTGAPYVICAPAIARLAGFDRAYALDRMRMLIRGMQLEGSLTRLSIKLLAREGDDLTVDATVFVPDVEEYWGNFPSFIGLTGFLERIRFAIDPLTDTLYFGTLPLTCLNFKIKMRQTSPLWNAKQFTQEMEKHISKCGQSTLLSNTVEE